MIFQHTYQKVLDGTKTQTRRLVKPCEKQPRWTCGQVYAVQPGRGKKAVEYIRIKAIWLQQDVHQICETDVRAEGFNTRDEFLQVWENINGHCYIAWVLEFELVW